MFMYPSYKPVLLLIEDLLFYESGEKKNIEAGYSGCAY